MNIPVKYNDPQPFHVHFDEPGLEEDMIQITHSTRATMTVPAEDFPKHFIISHENFAIVLPDESEITLDEDTRHGQPGFRGCRYVNGLWDSRYLFFHNITDVLEAACPSKQEEKLKEAHLAF